MFSKNRADFSAMFLGGKHSFTLPSAKLAQLLDISAEIGSKNLQKHPTLTMFPQKDFIPAG
ncbi:hypothetical protein JQ596_06850 [Bradyrhizobium manausense]|uniref:hypothetical protein n=1 Tax=Bradyrhizobium TaxID=374 RepID=UPI001BA99EAB|nr:MULTISPECIES: hypothetical protein [Bradyrhizobium]MBR0825247.1 hypothetical protein [Bradyrhizobium manausense]UVO28433.1 hypothetical protein KUF59_39260 [Bradyrhizobium arachidis]